MNTAANALPINGMNTKQISDLYPNLFTPAGFTFFVWGVLYLLQLGFILVQFKIKDQLYFKELSLWFCVTCIANASWILTWHYLLTIASVVVMLTLLFSLTHVFLLLTKNKMRSRVEWLFIKLPFVFYLAWICVATIANISASLVSLGWSGGFLTPLYWTIALIIIGSILSLFIAFRFKEPTFLLIFIWAFFGIYSRWIGTENELVANAARLAAVVLAVIFIKLTIDVWKGKATPQIRT
jgi:hypothetical protein